MTAENNLEALATEWNIKLEEEEFANKLDRQDNLAHLRENFHLPKTAHENGEPYIYLLGNSLGLQPKQAKELINQELDVWANSANMGHFEHPYSRPWLTADEQVCQLLHPLVGSQDDEISVMASLTANLHLLLCAFYHPTKDRYKIVLESHAFPSHHYAIESQLRMHGIDPAQGMIIIKPSNGEEIIRPSTIEQTLKFHGDSIAICLFSGVQYFTGQYFDIANITRWAHEVGAYAGFDLAHAVGNVLLQLHEWNVDFGVWCSYKYLNAGPGAIAGLFVHSKHNHNEKLTILRGWWGHRKETRFLMNNLSAIMSVDFEPTTGARGFQLSNPDILSLAALLASLKVFSQTSMEEIRKKSARQVAYLRLLLKRLLPKDTYRVITPSQDNECGAQLSIFIARGRAQQIVEECKKAGLLVDYRAPDVIRLVPVALYTRFIDVCRGARVFSQIIHQIFNEQ